MYQASLFTLGDTDTQDFRTETITAHRGKVCFECRISNDNMEYYLLVLVYDHINDEWIEYRETDITAHQWDLIKSRPEYYADNLLKGGK